MSFYEPITNPTATCKLILLSSDNNIVTKKQLIGVKEWTQLL